MALTEVTYRVVDPTAPKRVSDKGTYRIALAIMRDARSRTPIRTHTLEKGWRVEPKQMDGQANYEVLNTVRYAKFVEFGTRHMEPQPMLGPAVMAARAGVGS